MSISQTIPHINIEGININPNSILRVIFLVDISDEEIKSLEDYVNGIVKEDIEVIEEYLSREEAMKRLDMSRLPENASDTVRVIKVSDYDECLCAGTHVKRTSEIGNFRITSTHYLDGVQRIVFKLD